MIQQTSPAHLIPYNSPTGPELSPGSGIAQHGSPNLSMLSPPLTQDSPQSVGVSPSYQYPESQV